MTKLYMCHIEICLFVRAINVCIVALKMKEI